jgi:hypothetical protein
MLTLSNEQTRFLVELTEKLIRQDNRATQYPLFVIQIDKKAYGDSSWCSDAERKEDYDRNLMCGNCQEKWDKNIDVPDYCEDCDGDCFVWFNVEQEFDLNSGVFLTAEACEEHIRRNHYHYTNPKSYAVSAWRNPEMQEILKILFTLTDREIPSCYK